MTNFTYRDGIAVLQLVAFIPCLLFATVLCFKQGMRAVSACWRFLLILGLLRVIAAICQLLLMTHDDRAIVVTKLTCDLLGIAPLTLAAVGLLRRVNEAVLTLPKHVFLLADAVSLAGLGVGIAGAVQAVDNNNIPSLLKIALALFVACLGIMFCILGWLTASVHRLPRNERITLYSIYVCAPFLIVRMVYACIGDFGNDSRFSIFNGDPTIFLCMSVLEEIILMIICLYVGYMYPPTAVKHGAPKPRYVSKA
ncbi:hypothetical protein CCM_04726 [Cordyceps militaris CM01]|uniref:DUF7702 domain-containing protein n=1 Tax=Cordyceps militaris (strain CM01) TaxID=983644 RepID=G3JD26_CORMM|nr:uncharacterized protein CCM_04726 [Cordyceps militaris CM01]EGX93352.1 hypothetical protein CCM_04726 [Cordyceps militaris CM01]